MRVGSELLNICQEQVSLLTSGLGASFAIVALTERPVREESSQDVTFTPLIAYPEALTSVDPQSMNVWLTNVWVAELANRAHAAYGVSSSAPLENRRADGEGDISSSLDSVDYSELNKTVVTVSESLIGSRSPLVSSSKNQVVVPLLYQDVMVGILVTARVERGWNQLERYDIERVGKTLAASCVLDQRSQWLEQRLSQQSTAYAQIQDHQQEVLDDVLHQFRNPLTAIRTFGKLLVKRLQPSDRNRTVAESVVRESDRLQSLLKQLSAAVETPTIALPGEVDDLNTTTLLIPGAVDQDEAIASIPVPHQSGIDESRFNGPEHGSIEADDLTVKQARVLALDGSGAGAAEDSMAGTTSLDHVSRDAGVQNAADQDADEQDIVRALTGQSIQLRLHDPMEILEPLLFSAHAIAQEREIVLRLTCQDPRKPLMVDDKALREVLSNLIDNALKYTPEHGRVDVLVGLQKEGEKGQGIAIADTGPGIPLEDQPHLFERHFRGVQSQGAIPGTGLGLAIARLLTRHMGGDIAVFSPVDQCPLDSITLLLQQVRQGQLIVDGLTNEPQAYPAISVDPARSAADGSEPDNPLPESDEAVLWTAHGPGTLFIVWLPCE